MATTPRVVVFNSVSLDGYFADMKADMSWAHQIDPEFSAWVDENARGTGVLVFGRITYELMASFWPTPQAAQAFPVVAERMNSSPKIVFSRTLTGATWDNTRVVKSDPAAEIRRLKSAEGPDIVVMGSGTIIAGLTEEGLVDEFQVVVVPVILGKGRTMFDGISRKILLRRTYWRAFGNGCMFVRYEPLENADKKETGNIHYAAQDH